MRIPIAITALLLAAVAVLGWHNWQTLASLRAEQRIFAGQAAGLGISTSSEGIARITKRPREDRAAEARRVAANFIAYGLEMKALGDKLSSPDKAVRQRMMEQMDEVMSLDAEQLKILIEEVRNAPGINGDVQLSLLRFALERLEKDHPRDTLVMLTPEMLELLARRTTGLVEGMIYSTIDAWAREDPSAAIAWFRENRGTLPANALEPAVSALISGTARNDLRLALRLIGEFVEEPGIAPKLIGRDGQTASEKHASLAVLREWIPTVKDEAVRERVFYESLCNLVFGNDNGSADFQAVTRWVEEAKLTRKEMELFTRRDLLDFSYYVKSAETGKWTEWLAGNFPEDAANDQIWNIFTRWTGSDFQAAGEWLTTAPDGPAKVTAVRAYAETVARTDPQTAAQWALTLPPGKDRDKTLEKIHNHWPKDDPAGANAFAMEHGIK